MFGYGIGSLKYTLGKERERVNYGVQAPVGSAATLEGSGSIDLVVWAHAEEAEALEPDPSAF